MPLIKAPSLNFDSFGKSHETVVRLQGTNPLPSPLTALQVSTMECSLSENDFVQVQVARFPANVFQFSGFLKERAHCLQGDLLPLTKVDHDAREYNKARKQLVAGEAPL
jgi:hypothetical protein